MSQPCIRCGACCANFRVSFYWAETDMHPEGIVPAGLTVPLTFHHVAMRGTEQRKPRCEVLVGEIGVSVGCQIYAQRPSPCREFEAGDPRCDQARARHGLPPLAKDELG
ncbi:YkgJ family cysteine cluster protein [Achromobacter sp. GG226]|nr:YkgJ family cysteine cluster protein [Verticiella sp. GG226]